ncbi:MAG: hypothetical protein IPK82_44080 [Polyangiaceae bacterium]|nr:hypothetical protein [Polyangiaceae bacterium]
MNKTNQRSVLGLALLLGCAHCGPGDDTTSSSSSTGGSGGTTSAGGGGAGVAGATTSAGGTGGMGGTGGTGGGPGGMGGVPIEGLDPSFSGGLVTAGLGFSFDEIRAAARQPDGKIVAVGSTGFDVAQPQAASEVIAVRFGSNGTIDTTFGTGGQVLIAAHARAFGSAVAIQPDGKIVIAGGAQEWDGNLVSSQRTLVARLTANGILDSTFGGGDGVVLEESALSGTGIAVQPDGKIVVSSANNSIFRYNTDGARDMSFGTGGLSKLPSGAAGYRSSVGVAADGGLLTTYEQVSGAWAITRLTSTGSVDTSYGTNGSFTTAGFNTRQEVVRPDGSVVLCGTDLTKAAVFRVNPSGLPDPTFGGGDGKIEVDLPLGFDTFLQVAIDDSDRILVSNPDAVQVARFLANGTLDSTYGTAGIATLSPGFTEWEVPLVPLAGGPVIAVGMRGDFNTHVGPMGAVRLNESGAADSTFAGGAGTLLRESHAAPDSAIRSHLQADGSIVTVGVSNGFPSLKQPTLTRHLNDGSLDPSFGDAGWVSTSVMNLRDSTGLSDGSVVVAAVDFSLQKFKSDGAVDTTYGTAGTANLVAALGNNPRVTRITRDASNRVLAVGANMSNASIIVRVAANGSLDTSFNGTGLVALSIQTLADFTAVLSASSGAVMAAGPANNSTDIVVVRVLNDGTPDSTFGTAGQVIVGPYFEARAIAEQPSGKILVAGYRTSPHELAIVRLDTTGAVDTTFGTNGWMLTSIAEAPIKFNREQRGPGLAVLSDGRFYVTVAEPGALETTTVRRYTVDGAPDDTFGTSGALPIAPYGNWIFVDATLQMDGKLLLTGRGFSRVGGTEFGLARLE